MILALCAGFLSGVLGFVPLYGANEYARRSSITNSSTYLALFFAAFVLSFAILAGSASLCLIFAQRSVVLPFVLAEFFALVVIAILYSVRKLLRR